MYQCNRKKNYLIAIFATSLIISLTWTSLVSADECSSLTSEQKKQQQALYKAIHAYNGCDQTLDKCLEKKPVHFSVQRLSQDICRHIKAKRTDSEIKQSMANRAKSLIPSIKKATVKLDERTIAGDPSAPVTVVMYACARCPYCAKITPRLYKAVTEGSLKGKVKLFFRPFPIKSHEGSIEGGLAMETAASLGYFWPFVNLMYERYEQFCPNLLSTWIEKDLKKDKAAFETTMQDTKTRTALIASKQEGINNKVNSTPTLFINGTEYVYNLSEGVLEGVLEEAYEIATAK